MKRIARVVGVMVIGALLLQPGCVSLTRKEGPPSGVSAGGVMDWSVGSSARGVIVGAVVGGAAGSVIGQQMDQQAEELAYALAGATVERVAEGIQVTFPDGLLFAFESDDLLVAAREDLRTLAASLAKYPRTRSMIVGHTDSGGKGRYAQGLSSRRAESVATFLVEQGVDRSRLGSVGRGSTDPLVANDSDAGRRQNRRLEVAIYSDRWLRRNAETHNRSK
jgi:outer membrane protein OmpA-like peptidoglycan-associated protein